MGGIDFPNGISTDRRMRCRPLPAESCYFRRLIQEIDSSGVGSTTPPSNSPVKFQRQLHFT
jgi:hypothetical protein